MSSCASPESSEFALQFGGSTFGKMPLLQAALDQHRVPGPVVTSRLHAARLMGIGLCGVLLFRQRSRMPFRPYCSTGIPVAHYARGRRLHGFRCPVGNGGVVIFVMGLRRAGG